MKRLRWQLLIVLVALVAIGVLLLGQQQTTPLPGLEPEVEPLSGGVYTEALIGSPGRLNPLLDYYNQVDHDIDRLIYSTMIRFDDRGLPQGDLVETWGISRDGKTYNFSIRANANWHDGQPVTSDDIIFTIEMMRDEALPVPDDLRSFWSQVDVVALNEKTIQFILPEPFAPFLDYLNFGVLPRHILGQLSPAEIINADFNLSPVGSGPYRFQGLNVEQGRITGVVLAANPDYYAGRPFIEQVVFRYFTEANSALVAYQKGEVMGISQIPSNILPQALKEPNLKLFTGRLPRLSMIVLNLSAQDLPFFQDVDVRRALLMGLNRNYIVDRILGGQAIVANSPIFPESWAYYDGIAKVENDSQAALALLKKSGYTIPAEGGSVRTKDDVRLSFELVYPGSEPYESIAAWVKQEWARLGVEVNLKAVPYDELLNSYLEPRKFQAALIEINLARSPDPDPYPFWHQAQVTHGQNYSGWDDRQVSEYLEQARIEVDVAERTRLYRNFQVRFGNDIPALLLYYPVYTYAIDAQVSGVSIGPLYDPSDRFSNINLWYLISGLATPQP
jgi:peptide/nickel transport system substrate-binding protein